MYGGRGGGGRGGGRGGGGGFNRRGAPKQLSGPPPDFMPASIKDLFIPRPELPYLPKPIIRTFGPSTLTGLGSLASEFETTPPPPVVHGDTPWERRERKKAAKMAEHMEEIKEEISNWKPGSGENVTSEPYKTLVVARLAYETTERKLQREFEAYGPVAKVVIVKDKEGQSRGYGFVEFNNEDDMKAAYRRADGKKIDGRTICVDVERGRTVPDWKPRRLGGGLGESRKALAKKKRKQDSWYRPYMTEYRVLDAAAVSALSAAAQRAYDNSMEALATSSRQAAGANTRGGASGYSERFDREFARTEREALKAARLALQAAAESAAAAAAIPDAAATATATGAPDAATSSPTRRSRSRSRERGDASADGKAHEEVRDAIARSAVEPLAFPDGDGEVATK